MIDLDRVQDLKADFGEDGFREVVNIFFEEVREVLGRLPPGPIQPQHRDDMHFIKGSALSVGFVDLFRLCRDAERSCGEGQVSALTTEDLSACLKASARSLMTAEGVSAPIP